MNKAPLLNKKEILFKNIIFQHPINDEEINVYNKLKPIYPKNHVSNIGSLAVDLKYIGKDHLYKQTNPAELIIGETTTEYLLLAYFILDTETVKKISWEIDQCNDWGLEGVIEYMKYYFIYSDRPQFHKDRDRFDKIIMLRRNAKTPILYEVTTLQNNIFKFEVSDRTK